MPPMLAFVFAFVLAFRDPAPASGGTEPAATATTPAPAAEPSPDDKVICVVEQQMGSHFKKKTCLTRAQWKKRSARDRAVVEAVLATETSDVPP